MTYPELKKKIEKIKKELVAISNTDYSKWNGNGMLTTDGKYAVERIQEAINALTGVEMVL